tara:strand:- start:217 stop:777 length:561 start_codon:yes stop_codon:yes gene_type:complete
MITNEQWELIDEKYGKLLTTICSKISGDAAIANFDDNLQDLRLATMDAVAGFSRKEGKEFEDFWGTAGFNKYMKTCLWNLKNKKGSKISKRYHINKNTVDITEYSEILVAESHEASSSPQETFFQEANKKLTDEQAKVVNIISNRPELIKPNGKVNVTKLSEDMGCCVAKTRKVLKQIKDKFSLDI